MTDLQRAVLVLCSFFAAILIALAVYALRWLQLLELLMPRVG
jgi:hypothetical protein